jgi:hypothetical protein
MQAPSTGEIRNHCRLTAHDLARCTVVDANHHGSQLTHSQIKSNGYLAAILLHCRKMNWQRDADDLKAIPV